MFSGSGFGDGDGEVAEFLRISKKVLADYGIRNMDPIRLVEEKSDVPWPVWYACLCDKENREQAECALGSLGKLMKNTGMS